MISASAPRTSILSGLVFDVSAASSSCPGCLTGNAPSGSESTASSFSSATGDSVSPFGETFSDILCLFASCSPLALGGEVLMTDVPVD